METLNADRDAVVADIHRLQEQIAAEEAVGQGKIIYHFLILALIF